MNISFLLTFFRDEKMQQNIEEMEAEAKLLETVNTFEEKRHKKWINNLNKKR